MSIRELRSLASGIATLLLFTGIETAAQPALLWRTNYPGTGYGAPFCGVDALGNIYSAQGTTNILIVKHSPSGSLIWTFRYAGPQGKASFNGAAIDSAGNLYVAGTSTSALGANTIVVLKLQGNGVPAWTNNIGTGTNNFVARSLGLDEAGNVHVGGGRYKISNAVISWEILLLKLNSSGAIIAETNFDGPQHGSDQLLAMKVDPKTGATYVALSLGNSNNVTAFAFAKFDSTGALEWIRDAGETNNTSAPHHFVLLSQDAGIYFTDDSQGRPMVWKFNSEGTLVWKATYSGLDIDDYASGYSAVVDLFGNVTVAVGDLVVHFDRMGAQQWSARILNARSTVLAIDLDTVFAWARTTDRTLLLTRFEQDGSQRWSQTTTSSASTYAFPSGALVATNGFCIAVDGGSGNPDTFISKYTTNAGAYGPKIFSLSEGKTGTFGDTVNLSVIAQGTGMVTYQWFKSNGAITDATNSSFTILLGSNTGGSYFVRVTDSVGTTVSAAIPILAVFPLSDQWSVLNGTARFTLRIAGNGVPEGLQWQLNGSTLTNETGLRLKLTRTHLINA